MGKLESVIIQQSLLLDEGGRERIYAAMMEMEERMASVTSGSNESAPPTPRPLLAPPLPPIPGYQIPQREQVSCKHSGHTYSL